MARTATVKTGFLADDALAALDGVALVHKLHDGTLVRCTSTGTTRDGYVMARIVEGPHTGRTVRLDARTRLSATPLTSTEGAEAREVVNARRRLAEHQAVVADRGVCIPGWMIAEDEQTTNRLQADLDALLAA